MEFVDAHHHLWDLNAVQYPWLLARGEQRFFGDPSAIQKDYLLSDYQAESSEFVVTQSVHIQVGAAPDQSLRETEWLAEHPAKPEAIVAFCDLDAADREAMLDAQQAFGRVRGVRQILGRHVEEDKKHGSDQLLSSARFAEGLRSLAKRGLRYDCQLIPQQHERAAALFAPVDDLSVVICHAGSPWDQSAGGLKDWQSGLNRLAERPNTFCKLSGLGMFDRDWTVASLAEVCHRVVDAFGPERVMVGSNFPVDKLYRDWDALFAAKQEILSRYNEDEQNAMWRNTARQFYDI